MVNPTPSHFDLPSLVNNPNFNFINSVLAGDDGDPLPSAGDFSDSPYSHSTFNTYYVDTPSLITQIKNNPNLSIMSLNIQSLPAKFLTFRDLILQLSSSNCPPDIICLQEVWNVMDPSLFPLPGYQSLVTKTRSTGQGGGWGSMSGQASLSLLALPNQSSLKNYMNHSLSPSHSKPAKKSPLALSTDLTLNTPHSPPLNNSLSLMTLF